MDHGGRAGGVYHLSGIVNNNSGIFFQPIVSPADADCILLGLPFDGTVSGRPGARFGPAAIRAATRNEEDYSPYRDRDIATLRIADAGDMDLPHGDTAAVLATILDTARGLVRQDAPLVSLGGEHLVTLPVVRALHEQYGRDLAVIQFDAHADLREEYLGVAMSHTAVLHHICGLLGPDNVVQVGVRSGTADEFRLIRGRAGYFGGVFGRPLDEFGGYAARAFAGRKVYVTVDLDIFDPSACPGTGTPEPGGLTFREFLPLLDGIADLDIVGCDIVELSPDFDPSGISAALAAVILRELLLIAGKGHHE